MVGVSSRGRRPAFRTNRSARGIQLQGEKPSPRLGTPTISPSVENVDDNPSIESHSRRLRNRPNRIGNPPPLADHPPQIILGNRDLIDQVAVLFELLDYDCRGVLDQRLDEELE